MGKQSHKPPKAASTREYLALLKIECIHGAPAAIFGRVVLADDQPMEGFEVLTIDKGDAAALLRLIDKVVLDGDPAPASGS